MQYNTDRKRKEQPTWAGRYIMKLMDSATGKVIASMVADPNTSVEDAIMLNNLEECIIDPSTMEKGWRDEDGDEHWTEDLVLVDD